MEWLAASRNAQSAISLMTFQDPLSVPNVLRALDLWKDNAYSAAKALTVHNVMLITASSVLMDIPIKDRGV